MYELQQIFSQLVYLAQCVMAEPCVALNFLSASTQAFHDLVQRRDSGSALYGLYCF